MRIIHLHGQIQHRSLTFLLRTHCLELQFLSCGCEFSLPSDRSGIITYCNVNSDKMNLNLPVLVALLNVIPSAVAGNIVPCSLLQMRLGRHWNAHSSTRNLSQCVTVTRVKLKNLGMLRTLLWDFALKSFLITLQYWENSKVRFGVFVHVVVNCLTTQ